MYFMVNPDLPTTPPEDINPEDQFLTWEEADAKARAYAEKLGGQLIGFLHHMSRTSRSHELIYTVCILARMVPYEFRSPNLGEEGVVWSNWVISSENTNEESRNKYRNKLLGYFLANRRKIVTTAAARLGITEKEVRQGYLDSND